MRGRYPFLTYNTLVPEVFLDFFFLSMNEPRIGEHESRSGERAKVTKGDQRFFSLTVSPLVLERLFRSEKKNQEKPLRPGKIYCSRVSEDVFEMYV